ncbi:hypothetical protein QBC47DRAFT_460302 [Echria macrotheca]|uniref:F-box domain-containing protein n=1 Tax=Echria macrotheca TaxID=438768 RepID=A0AAJ0BE01_9PEZI|nr:hypothetical protein QBC47DRAFT_460302 [Echria macrotheca]
MRPIPAEIAFMILGNLSPADLRNVRLVARWIGSVADYLYIGNRLSFGPHDFNMVDSLLARNTAYAVRTFCLNYVIDCWPSDWTSPKDLDDFKWTITAQIRETLSRTGRPLPPGLLDTDGLLADDIVAAAHRCYLESAKAQKEALANPQEEIDFLKRTVSVLPRVTELVLSGSGVLRQVYRFCGVRSDRPARDILAYLFRHTSITTDFTVLPGRHLRALLQAVQAADTKLKRIEAGVVHMSILDETQFGLHSISPNLWGNVETFKLVLGLSADEVHSGQVWVNNGVLCQVLSHMPKLVHLAITHENNELGLWCKCSEHHRNPHLLTLDGVIPRGHVWPSLKHLELSHLSAEQRDIGHLLLRHKDTLDSFTLTDIRSSSLSTQRHILEPLLLRAFKERLHTEVKVDWRHRLEYQFRAWGFPHPPVVQDPRYAIKVVRV